MKAIGPEGIFKLLQGFSDKTAYALCIFAYSAGPDTDPIIFEGRCDGSIVEVRGPAKFGWDPIFEPAGTGKTFAQMDKEEKNAISHRYRALDKFRNYLLTSCHAK